MTSRSSNTLKASPVNPISGLATDYLNMFNEAIMLFEMAFDMPDMVEELEAWHYHTYEDHFKAAHFELSQTVLEAYYALSFDNRKLFDAMCEAAALLFKDEIEKLFDAMKSETYDHSSHTLALSKLKEHVAHLDAHIHGRSDLAEKRALSHIESLF